MPRIITQEQELDRVLYTILRARLNTKVASPLRKLLRTFEDQLIEHRKAASRDGHRKP